MPEIWYSTNVPPFRILEFPLIQTAGHWLQASHAMPQLQVWNKIDLLNSMSFVPPEAIPVCAVSWSTFWDAGAGFPGLVGCRVDVIRCFKLRYNPKVRGRMCPPHNFFLETSISRKKE